MKTISLYSRGQTYEMMVDDEDYEFVLSIPYLYVHHVVDAPQLKYVRGGAQGIRRFIHRAIYARHHSLSSRQMIDHIDGNGLNNQKVNLRIADSRGNSRNQRKIKPTGSKYKGVRPSYKGQWKAVIRTGMDNKQTTIKSSFPSERWAAIAYDIYARKYHGEFAVLNFPDAPVDEIRQVQEFIDSWQFRGKTSRFRGVSWLKTAQRWVVSFWTGKRVQSFGRFVDEIEAAKAYNQEAIRIFGDKAKLNVI